MALKALKAKAYSLMGPYMALQGLGWLKLSLTEAIISLTPCET